MCPDTVKVFPGAASCITEKEDRGIPELPEWRGSEISFLGWSPGPPWLRSFITQGCCASAVDSDVPPGEVRPVPLWVPRPQFTGTVCRSDAGAHSSGRHDRLFRATIREEFTMTCLSLEWRGRQTQLSRSTPPDTCFLSSCTFMCAASRPAGGAEDLAREAAEGWSVPPMPCKGNKDSCA